MDISISYVKIFVALAVCLLLTKLKALYYHIKNRLRIIRCASQFDCRQCRLLVGNTHQMADTRNYLKFVQDSAKEFDKHFVMWFGMTHPSFVCYDPASLKVILNDNPPKISLAYRFLVNWLGYGLLIENGNRWARNRRLITPAFHFDILKPYVKTYNVALDILINKWSVSAREHKPLDTLHDTSLCTLDIITRCALSVNLDCQIDTNHPYIKAFSNITKSVAERLFNIFHHNDLIYSLSSTGRKYYADVKLTHEFTENAIRQRQEEIKAAGDNIDNNEKKRLDFIDILISARYEDGQGLGLKEIRSEVDTFVFAGHDTTSSTLSSTIYCLARYPEHQAIIRSEVDNLLSSKNVIEWEDLPELKYTTLCIKEAMRLFTPVPLIDRTLAEDTEIDGKILAAGTQLSIGIFMLHRNPDVWDEPEKFDPLRFLPENCTKRHPYAYIPFSVGSRNCIGQNFAMNFLKVAIARLIHRYQFTVDMKNEFYLSLPLVLKLHGHDIYVEERKA